MRNVAILIFCTFVACLIVESKADCPNLDNPKIEEIVKTGTIVYRNCSDFKCNEDGSWSSSGCAVWECAPGKQIGFKQMDLSLDFPDCCEGPICAE